MIEPRVCMGCGDWFLVGFLKRWDRKYEEHIATCPERLKLIARMDEYKRGYLSANAQNERQE